MTTMSQLSQAIKTCANCVLSETRTQAVVGSGPVPATLMIIGEGPGAQEDAQGKPFVGRSGQLLTKMLAAIQINRDTDVYITNIVKCRPPNNRAPHATEVAQCRTYLEQQLALIQPKLLITLGAPALKTLLGETRPISQVRGNWYKLPVDYMTEPLYSMPLFHPSYLLRNDSKEKGSPKWLTWNDLNEIKTAYQLYKSESV